MTIKLKTLAATSLLSAMIISGCSAVQTSIEHRNLEASSQQSATIFLDPVPSSQKTVHVAIKNTSDQEMNLTHQVKKAIESHGYKVVNNPNNAHYLLQANVLKVGKMSVAAGREAMGHGYGSVISSVGSAAVVGAAGGNHGAMLGAGLVVGLADMAANSLVKDVNYTMITDVQVSERVRHNISESTNSKLDNGLTSSTVQKSDKTSHFERYRTRIVSNADKVNLKFAEAKPTLEKSLVKVLSGIF